jgi:hypothetical protein
MKNKGKSPEEIVQYMKNTDMWGQDPFHDRKEWKDAVATGDTQLGYWDWLQSNLEADAESTPTYHVTIHYSGNMTFAVKAFSNAEAEVIAREMFNRGEASHTPASDSEKITEIESNPK